MYCLHSDRVLTCHWSILCHVPPLCLLFVSAGGRRRGVEVCASQAVALILWRGPHPACPLQPGSQPQVLLLPGPPHQVLPDTSLQGQKSSPQQRVGVGYAKVTGQGKCEELCCLLISWRIADTNYFLLSFWTKCSVWQAQYHQLLLFLGKMVNAWFFEPSYRSGFSSRALIPTFYRNAGGSK